MLEGPGGIGKTRLLQWAEGRAQDEGFQVLWGYCLKESLAPFFPFEQVFRARETPGGPTPAAPEARKARTLDELPAVLLVEEARPQSLFQLLGSFPSPPKTLVISRDRPASLRQRYAALSGAELLWLSRTEGEEIINPGAMDALGERVQQFLERAPGAIVALGGLEYLVSQNAFLPVLRLVQFLRDTAESTGGHLLFSFPPTAFEARELSLLEAEGEVERAPDPASTRAAPESPAPAPPPSPATEPASTTLLRYLANLERLSAERPVLVLLDDLQWADSQSLVAFQFLSRAARKLRVAIVAAAREGNDAEEAGAPGAAAAPPGRLAEVLASLRQEGALHALRLEGLPASDLHALVGSVLGATLELPAGENVLREFLHRSGGNPFFVLETIRQLHEEGWLVRSGDHFVIPATAPDARSGKGGPADLPTTIRSLVARRLERLPPELRRFLQVAAVVGSEFDLLPVAAVLGLTPEAAESAAKTLADRMQLLDRVDASPRYSFGHPLMWETTLRGMTSEEVQARARQLAAWWASHRAEELDVVARLYHEARDRPEGVAWARRSLERAIREGSIDAMVASVAWWADLTGRSAPEIDALYEASYAAAWRLGGLGAFPEAFQLAQSVQELAQTELQRWWMTLGRADLLTEIDLEKAIPLLDELEHDFQRAGDRVPARFRVHLDVAKGSQLIYQGHAADAVDRFRSARSSVGPGGPETVLSLRALLFLGRALLEAGRLDETKAVVSAFLAPRTTPLPPEQAPFLGGFLTLDGDLKLLRGELPGALKSYEAAYRLQLELGSIRFATLVMLPWIEAHLEKGDLRRARELLEEGKTLAERFDQARPRRSLQVLSGLAEVQARRWPQARALLEEQPHGSPSEHTDGEEHEEHWETADIQHLALARVLGEIGEEKAALHELDHLEKDLAQVALRWRPVVYRYRARVRWRTADAKGARADLEKGVGLARTTQNRLAEGQLLGDLADLERQAGESTRRDESEHRSLELLRGCGIDKDPWALPAPN